MTHDLTRADFAGFFEAVRGFTPFAWQERLLDAVLTDGCWPGRITAPTGAGKTAVIDVHVFANALHAVGAAPRVPRRLAVVVDRRVLVDGHGLYAGRLADRLVDSSDPVVTAVAAALRRLVPAGAQSVEQPLHTFALRGGLPSPREWRVEPEVCTVLTATNDMFGSRLLLRGYGTSRRARPQEAGLLAFDCVAVVDEAHLSRQLTMTARRVADLVHSAPQPVGVPVLQVVETTATPDPAGTSTAVGVEDADLDASPLLGARLRTAKPVEVVELGGWPAGDSDAAKRGMAATAADTVEGLLAQVAPEAEAAGLPTTVGCVLNRVADAVAVTRELRRRGRCVVLLTGRMRPVDRAVLTDRFPGLLSIEGNPEVEVLVATQVVEVGVDLDLAGLVTDLAPGTALVQRAGRVNRRGLRPSGPVRVLVPRDRLDPAKSRTAPYQVPDLVAARSWLDGLSANPAGLAPVNLTTSPPPAEERRRTLWQRLGPVDAQNLTRTSTEGFAEPDLSLWISDDLSRDTSIGVVLRRLDGLDEEPALAVDLLRLTPPLAHETVALPRPVARDLLEGYLATGAPAYVHRGASSGMDDSVELLTEFRQVRAGDVVVLDADRAAEEVVPWSRRVSPAEVDGVPLGDAYDLIGAARRESAGRFHLRLGRCSAFTSEAAAGIVELVADWSAGEDGDPEQQRVGLSAALLALAMDTPDPGLRELLEEFAELAGTGQIDAVLLHDSEDEAVSVVLQDSRTRLPGEDRLQVWSDRTGFVPLDDHQSAVADRVEASARSLGLPTGLVDVLRVAALHHDDGKADERFQRGTLGVPDGEVLMAKSGRTSLRDAARRSAASRLPQGWRHEQLSVLTARRGGVDTDLALRLIGTTHGLGRPSFPHATRDLLPPEVTDPTAEDLFDAGGWEDLVERTDRTFSPWGTAYLEMVLRAADVRVSREGS